MRAVRAVRPSVSSKGALMRLTWARLSARSACSSSGQSQSPRERLSLEAPLPRLRRCACMIHSIPALHKTMPSLQPCQKWRACDALWHAGRGQVPGPRWRAEARRRHVVPTRSTHSSLPLSQDLLSARHISNVLTIELVLPRCSARSALLHSD